MRSRSLANQSSPAEYFGEARADYAAAKRSQYRRHRTGTLPFGTHADWHYRVEVSFSEMREQARDMDRNDALIGSLVDRAVTYTLQSGIWADPKTGDSGVDAELSARMKEWSESPDASVDGEFDLHQLGWLALRQMLVDGDIFGLPMQDGQLQLMEAHRSRTPTNTKKNVVHGILLDPTTRKRLQYWFTKEDVQAWSSLEKVSDMIQIDARDEDGSPQVFHVYDPRRISQTRGVTAFAPMFDPLGMLEDINFATMVKHQVSACWAIFRKRTNDYMAGGGVPIGPTIPIPEAVATQRTIQGMAPGMDVPGMVGEEITGFSPNIPSPAFEPHMRFLITLIGVNLGIPLVVALMEPGGSFSAYRGAIDQAKMGFRHNQKTMIDRFYRPVYRWKCMQFAADDPLLSTKLETLGPAFFACKWHKPAWPYIDPSKDADADLTRVSNCLAPISHVMAERGLDWDDVYPKIISERSVAIRAALDEADAINRRYNLQGADRVARNELLPLPMPKGVTAKLTGTDEAEAGSPTVAAGDPVPA
jgi:lambda family phage portal protein